MAEGIALKEIPTRVGMDRKHRRTPMRPRRDPHARGDGPVARRCGYALALRSPRAWGWTALTARITELEGEIPTRVGMDRPGRQDSTNPLRDPHARGDGPPIEKAIGSWASRSPRAWGWTAHRQHRLHGRIEIPTRVGMDRRSAAWRR